MPLRSRSMQSLSFLAALGAIALLGCSDPAAELEAQLEAGEAILASDPGEAVKSFKNALQIDPNSIDAHWGLARAYLAGGRLQQAVWEFEETVRLEPDHHRARLHLSRLLRFGRPEDQEASVEHAQHVIDAASLSESDPARWTAQLAKGRSLAALNRHDEAREAYEAAVELAPDEGATHVVLGGFLEARGEREAAEGHYRRLVELEPGFDATLVLARFLTRDRAGDAEAEALYRDAVAQAEEAETVRAHQALAGFLYARGRFDEAVSAIEAGIERRPGEAELVGSLAGLYHASGDLDRAEATLAGAMDAAGPADPGPALRLAEFRRSRGDFAGALEAVEVAIGAGGETPARLQKAELLIQSALDGGDPTGRARGRAIVDAELARDAGHPEARLVRGWLDLLEGDAQAAASSARRALDRRPEWTRAHLLLGRALAAQDEPQGARMEYERVLQLEPSNLETRRWLTALTQRMGDPQAALEHGRAVLRASPDDHVIRLLVADALLALGRPGEAAAELERIPSGARNAEALYAQGQLQAAGGDLEAGRSTLLLALESAPGQPEILAALFEIDQRTGRAAETLARVQSVLEARPDDARLHRLAGRAQMVLGRDDLAERSLRKAIELAPNDLVTYGVLSQFMVESGQGERVIGNYEQAVKANPKVGVLRTTLARLYETVGRVDDAEREYEAALKLDPSLAVAMNNLAWLLAERGVDLDRALDLAQEAKARLPDVPDVADTLGWVLYKKGIASAAIGYFQEAERLLPPDHPQLALVRLHLALAHRENGEADEARAVVDRALEAGLAPGLESVGSELRAVRDGLPGPGSEAEAS